MSADAVSTTGHTHWECANNNYSLIYLGFPEVTPWILQFSIHHFGLISRSDLTDLLRAGLYGTIRLPYWPSLSATFIRDSGSWQADKKHNL